MSEKLITDGIDALQAIPLKDAPNVWEITFRSNNAGMHHQLYCNGELSDWTDTADERSFLFDTDVAPSEVVIAAVDGKNRTLDLSDLLTIAVRQPGWVYRTSPVRSIAHSRGTRIMLLGDRATGQMDDTPLVVRETWPQWALRWAWGEDAFGQGGFGYDGAYAPGLGKGALGGGYFGFDAEVIPLSVSLGEEGTHQLVLRVSTPDGQNADRSAVNIDAAPPPSPPISLRATNYETQTKTLTLQFE